MDLYGIFKRQSFYFLIFFLLFAAVVCVKRQTSSPFLISLIFVTTLFLPGIIIKNFLKIRTTDFLETVVYVFTIGLITNLFLSLIAIFFGLTINEYTYFTFTTYFILIVLDLFLDKSQASFGEIKKFFKNFFIKENLLYIILCVIVVLILATVDQLGTNFTGDPLDHLAIMRKAVEGLPLSIENLSWVKNQFHIAYGIPIWHVYLSFLSKISQVNIFILFKEISTVLAFFVFVVWGWFLRKIFPQKQNVILILILFGLYYFGKNGYLFTRMPVPDTLNNLLLMPLCFGLALNYIFNFQNNFKHLLTLSLTVAAMGLIHWTQFFYYLMAMGFFSFLLVVFLRKDDDFRKKLLRSLWVVVGSLVLIIPILGFLQIKTQAISENIQAYSDVQKTSNNDRFFKFTPYLQLAYIFVPLIGLFIRKNSRLIFFIGIFTLGPLVFNIPWVYNFLRHTFSHVFVNRFYSNLGEWPYITWGLTIGFLLLLLDRLMVKLNKGSRFAVTATLLFLSVLIVFIQVKAEKISLFNKTIFSETTHLWLNKYYILIFVISIILGALIYILQKNNKALFGFFELKNISNHFTNFLATLIIVFVISAPAQDHFSTYFLKEIKSGRFFKDAPDPTFDIINQNKFGKMETITFIKNNIPAKSVFDTSDTNYVLPILADVHMASLTFDPEPTKKYKDLYNPNVSIKKKQAMLKEGDIDYLLVLYGTSKTTVFDNYNDFFAKIYSNGFAAIYKVNKAWELSAQ